MKSKEYNYYKNIANWSFEEINYISENYTNWIYEEEITKHTNKNSKILDLGTAGGENLLKYFPDCQEILGTDYSKEMIDTANKNLLKSGRKNIKFKVMDNLKMNTPNNYYDLVTARHTPINPKQIYKTLKYGGYLIVRGVDKLDCWNLKMLFGKGQSYNEKKPISLIDYDNIVKAGFKDVELIPIYIIEYYKTKEDLYALLIKTPILNSMNDEKIDLEKFNNYVKDNTFKKGIKLIRRYYGIVAKK